MTPWNHMFPIASPRELLDAKKKFMGSVHGKCMSRAMVTQCTFQVITVFLARTRQQSLSIALSLFDHRIFISDYVEEPCLFAEPFSTNLPVTSPFEVLEKQCTSCIAVP